MMDELLVRDLAALGQDSRREPAPLDDVVRAAGGERGLAVLPLYHVACERVARAAGGLAVLALVAAIVGSIYWPVDLRGYNGIADYDEFHPRVLLRLTAVELATLGLLVAGVAGALARRAAAWWIERRMRASFDPIAIGRRAVRLADPWATALPIAGFGALAIVIVAWCCASSGRTIGLYYCAYHAPCYGRALPAARDALAIGMAGISSVVALGAAVALLRRWLGWLG
ncbi:MAG TPA: hypothetical protein VLX92_04860, partial [Kofleriaceae bacterium]|nr:hypothetical protein [Kofleriaceae bacterium]